MTFGDFIRAVKADLKHDDSIVEDYDWERLRSYKNIGRLDELMEIIEGLKTNERFLALPYFPIEEDENTFVWNVEKTPFYKGARDGLGYMPILPIRMPSITHNVVDGYSFVTTFSMIQYSINYDNQRFLTWQEDKAITLSFIMEDLTFFVEDFDNPDNKFKKRDFNEEYKNYFKRLHNLYWENDRAKDFEWAVINVVGDSVNDDVESDSFISTLSRGTKFLIGCSALKEGRDSITCEDVVIGYLTVFKIILNDMRPLVYSLYDEEKWADESSWK